jgi:hypothetical protein
MNGGVVVSQTADQTWNDETLVSATYSLTVGGDPMQAARLYPKTTGVLKVSGRSIPLTAYTLLRSERDTVCKLLGGFTAN